MIALEPIGIVRGGRIKPYITGFAPARSNPRACLGQRTDGLLLVMITPCPAAS
jgi:hypothetical protein